jgi:hypothetical protein
MRVGCRRSSDTTEFGAKAELPVCLASVFVLIALLRGLIPSKSPVSTRKDPNVALALSVAERSLGQFYDAASTEVVLGDGYRPGCKRCG